MLVRVLNYRDLSLTELVNKALSGGHDGILLCDQECSDAAARGSHR
jgi:PTS system ascorbate-specific IIA component